MADTEYLIVGLGNPGPQYDDTRHNVGFIAVEEICRNLKTNLGSEKWDARYCRTGSWGARLTFVEPLTFMNLSGRSVVQFSRFYKIPPERILVIHDDLDMHPGRLKMVRGGGAGGHNGIRSIAQNLGSNDFYRLKIGIGRPGKGEVHADFPVEKYVLSKMSREESDLLHQRIAAIQEGLRLFIEEGPARSMSLVNSIK